mmetsp:Transcript_25320/g.37876  ORF Transcript_25320/g.37876 Transcript_25320/m.37876 type:complete len:529 (-) Transcript_25320:403-1989(-)
MTSKISKVSEKMTAEERKAKMAEERKFLQKFMEAALEGDGETLQKFALEYCSEKENVSLLDVYKDFRDGSKRTALHFACSSPAGKQNEQDIVIKILNNFESSDDKKSLIELEDSDGLTPLMLVCNNLNEKSYERIKYLVEIGGTQATLARSKAGAMALHYAAGAGANKEIIKLLYENGKEALSSLSTKIGSPLHWASGVPQSNDYSETIETLLEDCGGDVNVLNEGGISALVLAAASGNDSHAKMLVKFGADRGFILGGNMTVFHITAELGLVKTLTELLKDDVPTSVKETTSKCLKMKNGRGEAPLDLAVLGGHIDCVKLMSGIADDGEAKAFMEKSQDEWKQKKEKAAAVAKSEQADQGNLQPQEVAASILAKKSSISEESKATAAELKANGNRFFAKKEWENAINSYTQAIEHNPADETYYSNRSACYMSVKKYDDALYDAIIVRTLKPDWIKGCYRVSVALLALERFEDAAVSAFEGLSMDQENQELKSLFQKCVKKGRKEHEEQEKQKKDGKKLEKQTFFGET